MIEDGILTERLVLRPFKDGDAKEVLALMSDDYICRMAGIKSFKTIDEAKVFMANWAFEAYAMTEKGSDKVIGIIQMPCLWWRDAAGLGYWLAAEYRGRGYMTEAFSAHKLELLAGQLAGAVADVLGFGEADDVFSVIHSLVVFGYGI